MLRRQALGDEILMLLAVSFIEVDKVEKLFLNAPEEVLPFKGILISREHGMTNGTSNGSTKPWLIGFGGGGGEIPFTVNLFPVVGVAMRGGELRDGTMKKRQPDRKAGGWLGNELAQLSLEEGSGPHMVEGEDPPDW